MKFLMSIIPLLAAFGNAFPSAEAPDGGSDSNSAPTKYIAAFRGPKMNIYGSISFDKVKSRGMDAVRVGLQLRFANASAGPFPYHIHQVAAAPDCVATKFHFDPFLRNGSACTKRTLDNCEVGDLAGKWGKLPLFEGKVVSTINYIDPTLSLIPSKKTFIGNRAIVIHDASGKRVACANIKEGKRDQDERESFYDEVDGEVLEGEVENVDGEVLEGEVENVEEE